MLKKFAAHILLCLFLTGCYSSNIQLLNRATWFGATPSLVTVGRGDTLYSISKRYDVNLQELIQANGLRAPYNIKVGQTLRIPKSTYHIVRKGDTLYSISKRYNTSVDALVRANGLTQPYTISVGQKIALSGTKAAPSSQRKAPTATPSKKTTTAKATTSSSAKKKTAPTTYTAPKKRTAKFMWPVQGKVIANFGSLGKGRKNDGINISAAKGTAVKAADAGTVAYAGNELKGFGNLILIKHNDGWITAYAHNDKLLVKKGQKVKKGEKISTVGSTGGVSSPQLHFEVRAGKKAVNPRSYLP